jgi:hypothetical protein
MSLLIGIALLIRLPIPAWARLGLALFWVFVCSRDLGRITRGNRRIRSIRMGPGEAVIIDRHGGRAPVRIMSGSVVLARFAWLRLKCVDGLVTGELLRGDPASSHDWRRLQILWRQGPGTFGGRD